MTRAYIGIGSNLGDRVATIRRALHALDGVSGIRVAAASSIYESEPWGVAGQPPFANAVAALDTDLGADALLLACKRIEAELGRVAGLRYGPRAIDLDVILFGRDVIDTTGLVVPHPRMLERAFVVTPLLEVAPGVLLPDGTPVTAAKAIEGRVTGVLADASHTGYARAEGGD